MEISQEREKSLGNGASEFLCHVKSHVKNHVTKVQGMSGTVPDD